MPLDQPMSVASPLVTRTRELMLDRSRRLTYKVLAKETGLTKAFIEQFMWDTKDDYGVHKVTALYEFLAKKPLEVA